VTRARVLLVVTTDDASATPSRSPRKDYRVLAESLNALTIDRQDVLRSRIGRRLARLIGVAPVQAWRAFRARHGYDVIVSDGEHIGIPLALLLKASRSRVGHVAIGHRLTAAKKKPFFKWLKVQTHIDLILVHSRRQYELAVDELGIPPERLVLLPYQVDTDFWRADGTPVEQRQICSAGLEFRDYPTLVRAVDGIDVNVVIGAASHWSKRRNTAAGEQLPSNIEVSRFDYQALRREYARSAVVVVPLEDVDFQAGVTTILEAMSMGKPVVVTHTPGQTDVVEDRRAATRACEVRTRPKSLVRELAEAAGMPVEPTGYYVPPGDPDALRRAIMHLLEHPETASRLGAAGRRTVERLFTVDQFADRVRKLVVDVAAHSGRRGWSVRREIALATAAAD
jgi:glycosyltransferase involved in cell wall biosynthesis